MKRSWKVTITLAVVAVLAAAGGIATMKLRNHKDEQPPAGAAFEPFESVQIVPAHEITWQATADLVGTVFAMRTVTVRNELAGVVRTVGFQSGEAVEAGQILLQIDDTAEQADLAAVKAAVRVAEANIAQADSQIALAELELNRLKDVQARAVAEVELDRARSKLETARADRGRWVAEADQARARVAQVETRLAKLTITAPFRARAGLRTVHEGQYLAEGTDVITLQELTDDIYLDFAIPQEYASRAQVGMAVMARAELLGPEPIRITVAAVDATVNLETRNLRIRAIVDNTAARLVPGMSVQVSVPIDEPRKLVVVPSTAVRRAAYGNSIFVVAPDEGTQNLRAHQRFVTLGQALGDEVIVLEGLKAGEQVAAAGSFKLRDGVKVMSQPPEAPAGAPGGPAPGH